MKIQKIAEEIYEELGYGHSESVYQKSFEVALRLNKIPYENQRIVPIFYKKHNVGEGKPDLIVNKEIVIELKSIGKLSNKEETQLKKYMEVLSIKNGFLINFPQPSKEVPIKPEVIEVINYQNKKEKD